MENQHRKIKGYRELSQAEIDLMNDAKALGIELGELVEKIEKNESTDQRWLEEGKTSLQTGLMQVIRSVAKPDTF